MRRRKLEIRKYQEEDINSINRLGGTLHNDFKFELNVFSSCLVIDEDGSLIGFVIYSIMYDRAEIIDIIIDPLYRNMGYGKKLLSGVIGIINDLKCLNITLEVSEKNKVAIKLYESLGFIKAAVRKNYYDGASGYLMEKDLR